MTIISEEYAYKFADDWIDSWNSHDLDRVMSHYDEELIYFSPFVAKLAFIQKKTWKNGGSQCL